MASTCIGSSVFLSWLGHQWVAGVMARTSAVGISGRFSLSESSLEDGRLQVANALRMRTWSCCRRLASSSRSVLRRVSLPCIGAVYHEDGMDRLLAREPDLEGGGSPFQPGTGKLPPYLAGRQPEQELIRGVLSDLGKRTAPASDVILYGPRGNGKTALVEWSRREAVRFKVQVLSLQGGQLRSEEQAAASLAVEKCWLDMLRGFRLGPVGVGLGSLPPGPVSTALARRIRKGPSLILVDEAHMLGIEAGQSLLGGVQALRSMELPVLLILAGTPDLPRHLRTMGASFWVRNKQLRIGRLELGVAADAVRVPLQERGRSIEDEALQRVAAESHGYPFFLQIWGDLLWKGCADPAVPVSLADVERAWPKFQAERAVLYRDLLAELRAVDLVSVAAKVAAEFATSQRVLPERITMAIQSSLRQQGKASDRGAALEAGRVLRQLGYIWPVVDQDIEYCEPGIPSLMRFVTRNEQKAREARGEVA